MNLNDAAREKDDDLDTDAWPGWSGLSLSWFEVLAVGVDPAGLGTLLIGSVGMLAEADESTSPRRAAEVLPSILVNSRGMVFSSRGWSALAETECLLVSNLGRKQLVSTRESTA